MRYYGFNPVISINKFTTDTDAEIDLLKEHCKSINVSVALNDAWAKGGEGAIELANCVVNAVTNGPDGYKPLYDLEWSFEKKIETIASCMYGADHVEYTVLAKQQLRRIEELGLGNLAVCIAKTQKSLSDNEHKKGSPKGFTFKIREVELSSGAGFIVPIAGTIMRMPGLPSNPCAEKIDVDEDGKISGLF
jgi:formate--tetrahydrofolate ligase